MSDGGELTFFVWADTHFGYKPRFGDDDLRHRAVRQMRELRGYPYPAQVGGCVGEPAFILHCGDYVDGGGGEEEVALYLYCMRRIALPSYETLGNHELPNAAAVSYFVEKYRGRYYSFEAGGVRFISLYKPHGIYEEVPPMDAEQLQWLAGQLAEAGPDKPLVIFCHARPENMPNAADLDSVLSKGKVILMFVGHTHLQWSEGGINPYDWNGRPCVIVGHVRDHPIDPIYGRTFAVVRITRDQVARPLALRCDT